MNLNIVITPRYVKDLFIGSTALIGCGFILYKAIAMKRRVEESLSNALDVTNGYIRDVAQFMEQTKDNVADKAADIVNTVTQPTNVAFVSEILGPELTNKYLNFVLNSNYDYVASSNSYIKTNETFKEKFTRLIYESPEAVSEYYADLLGLKDDWRESLRKHGVSAWNG